MEVNHFPSSDKATGDNDDLIKPETPDRDQGISDGIQTIQY